MKEDLWKSLCYKKPCNDEVDMGHRGLFPLENFKKTLDTGIRSDENTADTSWGGGGRVEKGMD